MTSKSILSLILFMLSLPMSLSGEELLLQVLSSTRDFSEIDSLQRIPTEDTREIHHLWIDSVEYWTISEEISTKSGKITYVVLLNISLEIAHMAIPNFENQHNASLTSSAFLRQFKREQPTVEPIRIGHGVDAISGATSSTLSLIEAINASVMVLQEIMLDSE